MEIRTTNSTAVPPQDRPAQKHGRGREHKKSGLSRRIERGRKPIVALMTCLTVIMAMLSLMTTGLQGLTLHVLDHLELANTDLVSLQSHAGKEMLVRLKLEQLTDTKLGGRFFETHTNCLVRGINYADAYFHNRDYTEFPEVRRATIDWVKDNCDRRYFAPQVANPKDQFNPLSRWESFRHQAKTYVDILKSWFSLVLIGNGNDEKSGTSAKPSGRNFKRPHLPQPSVPNFEHLNLPQGYQLVDCDVPPCRLVYIPPTDAPAITVSAGELLQLAEHRVKILRSMSEALEKAFRVGMCLQIQCLALNTLIIVLMLALHCELFDELFNFPPTQPRLWSTWYAALEPTLKGFMGALLVLEVEMIFSWLMTLSPLTWPMAIYAGLVVLGITSFALFLVAPESCAVSARLMIASSKELDQLTRSFDTSPDDDSLNLSPKKHQERRLARDSVDHSPDDRLTPSPTKQEERHLLSATTLQEDIDSTLEASRASLCSDSGRCSNYASEDGSMERLEDEATLAETRSQLAEAKARFQLAAAESRSVLAEAESQLAEARYHLAGGNMGTDSDDEYDLELSGSDWTELESRSSGVSATSAAST